MSIIRATVWSNLGEAIQVRNVFTYSSDYDLQDLDKVAITDRLTDMYELVAGWATTVWATEGVHFEELVAGTWQPRGEVAMVMTGEAEEDILPFMNSGLVLAVTGFAKTIGKKFIAGFTEGSNLDGALMSGLVVDLAAFLGYYVSSVTGVTYHVWSPGTVSKTGVFHSFISGRVNDLFATQRRRHPSVGI